MKQKLMFILSCLALILTPLAGWAKIDTAVEDVLITKDQYINRNYYKVGREIRVEGTLEKDAVLLGDKIDINGAVGGDVIAIATEVNITGPIAGSVRVFANDIKIDSSVSKNVDLIGENIFLLKNSEIGWDAVLVGNKVRVLGEVGSNLISFSNDFSLSGKVGNNVNLYIGKNGKVSFVSGTSIGNDLNYISPSKAQLSKVFVGGKENFKLLEVDKFKDYLKTVSDIVFHLFGLWLIGLVLVLIFKKKINRVNDLMTNKFWLTVLLGLVFLFITPVVLIVIAATIIGIPISLVVLCLYLLILYLSKLFVAIWLGLYVLSGFQVKKIAKISILPAMFIGVFFLYLLFLIPYVGPLLKFFAIVWGSGGLLLAFRKSL